MASTKTTLPVAGPVVDTAIGSVVLRARPTVLPDVETAVGHREVVVGGEGANVDSPAKVISAPRAAFADVPPTGAVA